MGSSTNSHQVLLVATVDPVLFSATQVLHLLHSLHPVLICRRGEGGEGGSLGSGSHDKKARDGGSNTVSAGGKGGGGLAPDAGRHCKRRKLQSAVLTGEQPSEIKRRIAAFCLRASLAHMGVFQPIRRRPFIVTFHSSQPPFPPRHNLPACAPTRHGYLLPFNGCRFYGDPLSYHDW